MFGEAMSAALALPGNGYYDDSWSRAAAMVTSPPLRPDADTTSCLVSRLAKCVGFYGALLYTNVQFYCSEGLFLRAVKLSYHHCR